MLDIAICDDEPGQLAILATYTLEFVQENHLEATIHQFTHPDELINICAKQRFHIYILDIVMPMINGVDIGKIIREHDQEAYILYATHEPSFALQSFVTNPINYLLKPIEKQLFFKTLHLAVAKLALTDDITCVIKVREGMRVLRISEILYCEYSNHTVTYTLVGTRTVTTKVIKESFTQYTERLLKNERFVRPHVSYVVNMDYIESFTKTSFTLRNGQSIPIVAKKYSAVRDRYINYLMAKEHGRCKT